MPGPMGSVRPRLSRLASALFPLFLALGCGSDAGEVCSAETQCEGVNICVDGRCADKCRADQACATQGRCTSQHGKCVVAGDDDCKRSGLCNGFAGLCTAREGVCVANSAADCAASAQCRVQGRCAFAESQCVAKSARACTDSVLCGDDRLAERYRACVLDPEQGRCTACEATKACTDSETFSHALMLAM